ncbi:N-glycosidase [Metarhizium anisopliae]|nr:N-glycosidase [Metarhizium anisopliae]
MYHKALLFNDQAVAAQVLAAGHPRNAKALGRQVQNFSDETWKKHRAAIVRQGNLLKFTAAVTEKGFRKGTGNNAPLIDGSLREMLLATGTREIVEASPSDKIWGIGCKAADAERRRAYWGLNLLGKALMEVRSLLREQTPQT